MCLNVCMPCMAVLNPQWFCGCWQDTLPGCASHMSCLLVSFVLVNCKMHMCTTCVTYVAHVHHMCYTCAPHVHHMCYICYTCGAHVLHMLHMCTTRATHVLHMCTTCATYVLHTCPMHRFLFWNLVVEFLTNIFLLIFIWWYDWYTHSKLRCTCTACVCEFLRRAAPHFKFQRHGLNSKYMF